MSRQFPIFCHVERDDMTPVRFGAREGFKQKILVGTSAKNSHEFATVTVERFGLNSGAMGFRLLVDGVRVKSGVLRGKEYTPEFYALAAVEAKERSA